MVLRRQQSELRAELLALLDRLRPAMWRPDTRGPRLLAAIEQMEHEGTLVEDGGALVGPSYATPTGQAFFERGIMESRVITPLRAAGLPARNDETSPD